ncbi:MAG TPA: IS66 family insertion sequence element accessory protein TnpB [Chthoniobacterales bacterium]
MMGLGAATRVWLAPGATDLRKSFDGLHALVRHRLELDPLSGHLFAFTNRSRTRLKILFFDGSGPWVCAKRLEKGRFCWPPETAAVEGKISITREELALLLGGIDLERTRRREWWRAPAR